jgi:hypothetical protein
MIFLDFDNICKSDYFNVACNISFKEHHPEDGPSLGG